MVRDAPECVNATIRKSVVGLCRRPLPRNGWMQATSGPPDASPMGR